MWPSTYPGLRVNGALGKNENVTVNYAERNGLMIASSVNVIGPLAPPPE